MMKRKNNKRGFTIVELTIVVAVIAILSAVLIPTFSGIIKKSRQSADQTAVRNLNELIVAADDEINDRTTLVDFLAKEENGAIDLENYLPMSKNYSFVYSVEKNVVMLLNNKTGKVEFPADCADVTTYVVLATDKGVIEVVESKDDAVLVASKGGAVAVETDLVSDSVIAVTKPLVVDLAANISIPTDTAGDGVFQVKKGATLTINGTGTVNGVGNNDYNMAVFADGGDVVINGGDYTNVGATDDSDANAHFDLIYAKHGATVTITGGTFKCETPNWTLNSNDSKPGTFVISGGSFYKFDPSNTLLVREENVDTTNITIAEGFHVEQDGDWYKVVPNA